MNSFYLTRKMCLFFFVSLFWACSNDDSVDSGEPMEPEDPVSPVNYDLNAMPYATLSEYNFFSGEMKDLEPVYGVLPYEPISSLFVDYAHKKRFVWMPEESTATYQSDGSILEFPTGTILIKSFYYDTRTDAPDHKNIETRLMIRKPSGWVFANYIWNENQDEAHFDLNGAEVPISFMHEGQELQANYEIPHESTCFTCHKNNEIAKPIGVKPESLAKHFDYGTHSNNQLAEWQSMGYLQSYPTNIQTVVDYEDESQPLELRVRSYMDINCAHCHIELGHCDYTSMRFGFQSTENNQNMGVCIPNNEFIPGQNFNFIIEAGNADRSALSFRIHSTEENIMMPQKGRSLVHTEAVEMIDQWINSLTENCN